MSEQLFTVNLIGCTEDNKVKLIKLVREETGLGLKEAKDMVDGVCHGGKAVLLSDASEEDAEYLKEVFEDEGAKVAIEPITSSCENVKYTNGLPGRNWDILSIQFNNSNIPEIEQDSIDSIRYLSKHPEMIEEHWLFKYGGTMCLGENATVLANSFTDKMYESGSWILAVTNLFVTRYRRTLLQNFLEAINGEKGTTASIYEKMVERGMRKAQNAKENELLRTLIETLGKFPVELSAKGLETFLWEEVAEEETDLIDMSAVLASEVKKMSTQMPEKQYSVSTEIAEIKSTYAKRIDDIKPFNLKQIVDGNGDDLIPPLHMEYEMNISEFSNKIQAFRKRIKDEENAYDKTANEAKRYKDDRDRYREKQKQIRERLKKVLGVAVTVLIIPLMFLIASFLSSAIGALFTIASFVWGIIYAGITGKKWPIGYVVLVFIILIILGF